MTTRCLPDAGTHPDDGSVNPWRRLACDGDCDDGSARPDQVRQAAARGCRGPDRAGRAGELRRVGERAGLRAVGRRDERAGRPRGPLGRAARRPLRPRRHRRAAVGARQPARAVHLHLRPQGRPRGGRPGRADRLDPRQPAARPRPGLPRRWPQARHPEARLRARPDDRRADDAVGHRDGDPVADATTCTRRPRPTRRRSRSSSRSSCSGSSRCRCRSPCAATGRTPRRRRTRRRSPGGRSGWPSGCSRWPRSPRPSSPTGS